MQEDPRGNEPVVPTGAAFTHALFLYLNPNLSRRLVFPSLKSFFFLFFLEVVQVTL